MDAERLERDRGLPAHVGAGVERGQVEVAAAVERHRARAVAEQEVLELGADVEGVEAHLGGAPDRAAQDVARVALIRSALGRQHVAEHAPDALLLRTPGQHREGRGVRHRDHVRLLDRVEAGDRGTVEAHPGLERPIELGGVDRERLQLADDIGEPQANEADLALGDDRPDILRCDRCVWHPRPNYADASSQLRAQGLSSFSAGARSWPFSVSAYCTRTGGPGKTVRSTSAYDSSSLRRSESMRSERSGTAAAIVEKRSDPPCIRISRIAPVQRRPTNSIAWWK